MSIPKHVPGRQTGIDFIEFNWCGEMDNLRDYYTVVIEVLDTSGASVRSISKLHPLVELPPVKLPNPASLSLIPSIPSLPRFDGDLVRGSAYYIPRTGGQNGIYQLDREGMLRPN
uniref:Uncharacterized protein n=1 Tax=Marseillevirus LCMAC101 TaxID=2506602 RepID=A0A481YQN9_9VIRU|nr:MAG: uncharacterized protein LCMAC101_00850 [Marseillevirus LCMAC101]